MRVTCSRLTPISDFIKVETSSFEAKEEEEVAASVLKWHSREQNFSHELKDISKRTGLPSRYLRTIFRGHMSPIDPWLIGTACIIVQPRRALGRT